MENESRQTADAIKLLKECDSGTKMAVIWVLNPCIDI